MKQITIFTFALLTTLGMFAQANAGKTDIRIGIGPSLLGTGDFRTLMIENELNHRLNNYFAASIGLGFARSNRGVFETVSFLQGNGTLYLSPFQNSKRNDFRIGAGISYYSVSDAYQSSSRYENGQLIDVDYEFEQRSSFGFILAIEHTYSLTNRLLLGIKAFTQPYENGDINSGILLKMGVRL